LKKADTPRVQGVRLDDGEVVKADLIVDASGRRSPIPRLIGARVRPLPERAQESGLLYISRYFRLRSDASFPSAEVPIMASLGWATAMAFPADRGTFCLIAIIASIDPLRRVLARESGFSAFHAAIPLMAPWLNAGRPIAPISTMARVENRYRRLVDRAGPIVDHLVLLGDAAMHTNPTAGRGVSLAFAHVHYLAESLDRCRDPHDLTIEFDAWTDHHIAAWYDLQAGADASLLRRAEAAVRDETLPPPDGAERLRTAIIELSKQPGPAAIPFRRLRNLVSLPTEVLGDPAVRATGAEYLARRSGCHLAAGPNRAAFAAALS
jgi:2-polyprenyl-6-methoxyphenol hydroxylase-like FAD-dependent oxidoreductase